MFFYTYVLQSRDDGKLYTGWTVDLRRRILEHNKGKSEATKFRGQFKLLYYEACLSKVKAIQREKQLKTGFGRGYLKRRLF